MQIGVSFDSQQAAKQIDSLDVSTFKTLCQEFLLRQEIKIAVNYFFYTLQCWESKLYQFNVISAAANAEPYVPRLFRTLFIM